MMNGALRLGFLFGFDLRKELAVVLVVLVVSLVMPFLAVFSMGSQVVQFLARTPSAESANTQGFYMGGDVPGNTYAWGNCTYWSFAMRLWAGYPIPTSWGNANTWDDRARADGYLVDHSPAVGAVYQTDAGQWGHVAYVIGVDAQTGKWTISEMNNVGLNIVNTRTFEAAAARVSNFIHGKKGAAGWIPLSIPLEKQYTSLTSRLPS